MELNHLKRFLCYLGLMYLAAITAINTPNIQVLYKKSIFKRNKTSIQCNSVSNKQLHWSLAFKRQSKFLSFNL